jgi:serine protease
MRANTGCWKLTFALFTSLVAAASGRAATWSIQEITRTPGQSAALVISIAGDGQTAGAQLNLVFDEARLLLPQASGALTGGSNGGTCARTSSNGIVVLTSAVSTAPLPSRATTLCTLPFTVAGNAQRGRARVAALSLECSNAQGISQPCTSNIGGVIVDAPLPPPQPAPPALRQVIVGLAPSAPSVSALVNGNFAAGLPSPLQAFNTVRPQTVRRLVPERRGDALTYVINNPQTPVARLQRGIIVNYATAEMAQQGLIALRSDSMVDSAVLLPPGKFASEPEPESTAGKNTATAALPVAKSFASDSNQYHRNRLNIPEAWTLAGGWGLVFAADSGIAESHPGLRAFDTVGTQLSYTKGNYLSAMSGNEITASSPDERSGQPTSDILCDNADGVTDGMMRPPFVGHGTHVAGLVSANAYDTDNIEGTCANCGFAVRKIMELLCVANGVVQSFPNLARVIEARDASSRFGGQVFSASFGDPLGPQDDENCLNPANELVCAAIAEQIARDVLLPSAAGNSREGILIPAEDRRIPAIAGSNETDTIWDDMPGTTGSCVECGSNFRQPPELDTVINNDRSEVSAPAKNVRSTFYPGFTWSAVSSCGDAFDNGGPSNDGIGLCTGTSMSTPIIAGVYGLLRSINPLVPAGSLDNGPVVPGIRTVVANAASLATNRENKLGFGIPNAATAARAVLGQVRGLTVKNRAIPLFGLYSPGATDYAVTANPQLATALQVEQENGYANAGPIAGAAVPGYSAFPGVNIPQAPRARAYVLSTEFSPVNGANLIPLYLLERCRPGSGCAVDQRDWLVITRENELNFAVNQGYAFYGLQGYVYELCNNEPACIPPGAQRLYLQCNAASADCAVFLEEQKIAFENAGYTAALNGGVAALGYAYGTANSDGDLLPDAVEYVAGLNRFAVDSDGDGLSDHQEYPLAGLPSSDPCNVGASFCGGGDNIFKNGFE